MYVQDFAPSPHHWCYYENTDESTSKDRLIRQTDQNEWQFVHADTEIARDV